MKKVLFATTALVATAGVASADVDLSGSAQMGIQGGSDQTTQFVQDIDVTFSMSGTADNGLTFGAAIDLDETEVDVDTDDGGVAIFISGELGTLTMGDTDGALDWAMTEVDFNGAGSINDDHTAHAGFNGNGGLDGWYDGQILRYDYSFGDFAVAVSVEQDDDGTDFGLGFDLDKVIDAALDDLEVEEDFESGNDADDTADPIWGLGVKYDGAFAGGTFGVGLGYQFTSDGIDDFFESDDDVGASVLGVSASVALDSGFSAAVNYSMIELETDGVAYTVEDETVTLPDDAEGTHVGIGVSYTFDAITVHANYGQYDWDGDFDVLDSSGYGLSAEYDFGGGLAAQLGYGYSDLSGDDDDEHTWSFGLAMSF